VVRREFSVALPACSPCKVPASSIWYKVVAREGGVGQSRRGGMPAFAGVCRWEEGVEGNGGSNRVPSFPSSFLLPLLSHAACGLHPRQRAGGGAGAGNGASFARQPSLVRSLLGISA